MGRIRILDEHTINQIAAGEVVERPASVVKELVENALDAQSRRITVEVEAAGTALIRVTDDGHGMSRADLLLSVERHATSKLTAITDLERLSTLGFRGEALPSIAAVARLEIVTREPDAAVGYRLRLEPGGTPQVEPTGTPPGTIVTVRDLFFNLPARRKHLKSLATEFQHISRVVYALALAHPEVAFRLVHNGREVLRTPGQGQVLAALSALFGPALARQLLPLEKRAEKGEDRGELPLLFWGYLGRPQQARANREHQYVFVNGRFVRSPLCREAVEAAYRGLLPRHRYPIFFLYLQLPAKEVDVNIHPTKERVRFLHERALRRALYSRVQETLRRAALIPAIDPASKGGERSPPSTQSGLALPADILEINYPATNGIEINDIAIKDPPTPADQGRGYPGWPGWRLSQPLKGERLPSEEAVPALDDGAAAAGSASAVLGRLRALAQVERSYIIAQGPDGLYIVDQHAAHERLLYERFLTAVTEGEPQQQLLGVPMPVALTPGERALLEEAGAWLRKWGFLWEPFGSSTILLRAVPAVFGQEATADMFLELLDRLEAYRDRGENLLVEQQAAIILGSCKAAVKARDHLTPQEQQALLDQLAQTREPFTCPHGRPTILHLSLRDLERYFKRVQ